MSREYVQATMAQDVKDGGIEEITIEGWVNYEVDINYGADADGNRGSRRTVVEDVEDIKGYDVLNDEIKLSVDQLIAASEILANKFLEGG